MIPLIMFASAARGLTLGTMGFLQYLGPTLQLLVAVFIFHETVPTFRWIAMGVVWVALGCLSADWLLSSVRAKRLARAGTRTEAGHSWKVGLRRKRREPRECETGTKLAQHAINREFLAIFRALGEFCHAQDDNRLRRAKKVTPKTPHQPNKVTVPNFARNSIT